MTEILFTATRKDFRVDHFSTGGPGGQNQNRKRNGVRITHIATGLVAESRTFKSESQNRKAAFKKLGGRILAYVTDLQNVSYNFGGEAANKIIRTYHAVDNRVKDHASGATGTYTETLNDPSKMIEARAGAMQGLSSDPIVRSIVRNMYSNEEMEND